MSEKYRGPRAVPDRIIGPNNHPLVWYATLWIVGVSMWIAIFSAALWVFKR